MGRSRSRLLKAAVLAPETLNRCGQVLRHRGDLPSSALLPVGSRLPCRSLAFRTPGVGLGVRPQVTPVQVASLWEPVAIIICVSCECVRAEKSRYALTAYGLGYRQHLGTVMASRAAFSIFPAGTKGKTVGRRAV